MPTLLPTGTVVANFVQSRCDNDYAQLCTWFGFDPGVKFNVTIAGLSKYLDGSGGAFHDSCKGTNITCDIKFNPVVTPALSEALLAAEVVEVFEGFQGRGWDCGASNGEGLSRVLAAALYPGVTDDYSTAAAWLDTNTRPNWIDATNMSDLDSISNGCAVLFLNWMNAQLGINWKTICQNAATDLGSTYAQITGKNDGWSCFRNLLDAKFPLGTSSNVTTDNPFPLA